METPLGLALCLLRAWPLGYQWEKSRSTQCESPTDTTFFVREWPTSQIRPARAYLVRTGCCIKELHNCCILLPEPYCLMSIMLSVPPHIHSLPHLNIFEPGVHNATFKFGRSPEDIPPSCVYLGVQKSQKAPPPVGHKWIIFWHVEHSGEDRRRVVEASWTAAGRGTVVRTNKKPNN